MPARINRIASAMVFSAVVSLTSVAMGRDVIYVPTPPEVVLRMLELTKVGPGDTVIDLGSGDGRIAIAAVRDFGADKALGIDIDADLIADSNQNARAVGVQDKVKFRQGDLFEADISEATVVTMYLLGSINERLKPKLLSELKPGTRIVSHDFGMTGWETDHHEQIERHDVYVWTVPAQIQGNWRVQVRKPGGEDNYVIRLDQNFNKAAGSVQANGGNLPVAARLAGAQISLMLGERQLRGKVEGASMSGTVDDAGGGPLTWQAQRID